MQFTSNEIKRAIRDFENAAQDLLQASPQTLDNRVNRIMDLARSNPVITEIVSPLLQVELDWDSIFTGNGFWINHVQLPIEPSERIAVILQLLDKASRAEVHIDDLSHKIYKQRSYAVNISQFLSELVSPAIRDLFLQLHDMYEDNVEGKQSVAPTALQIFNYGTIAAHQGANVAIGQSITQNTNYTGLAERIMDQVRTSGDIPEDKHAEIQQVSQHIEEELKKSEPDKGKLKSFVGKMYALGEKALLKLSTKVVDDPRWSEQVTDFLLS
ncbi:hypothetical protein [Paenibacillus sp. 1P03SA]|uniref:hypothetical protein n=1 Tax=Paenibacillus sp. 1P03SA TaxID=3132294 RepID=UPI0039A2396C